MKTLRSFLYACLLLLGAVSVYAAHWRGFEDGRQTQIPAAAVNTDGAALDAILREIAANHWQGTADDELYDPAQLHERFQRGRLSAHCYFVSAYAEWRLTQAGYQARKVAFANLQPERWDGRSDGHVALEVWHPDYGQWVFVDLFFNRLYPQTALSFVKGRMPPVMLADDLYSNPAETAFELPEPETWALGYDHLAQLLVISVGDGAWWYGDAEQVATMDAFNAHLGTKYRYRDDFLSWAYGI